MNMVVFCRHICSRRVTRRWESSCPFLPIFFPSARPAVWQGILALRLGWREARRHGSRPESPNKNPFGLPIVGHNSPHSKLLHLWEERTLLIFDAATLAAEPHFQWSIKSILKNQNFQLHSSFWKYFSHNNSKTTNSGADFHFFDAPQPFSPPEN